MKNTRLPIVYIHGSFANSQSWKKIINYMDQQLPQYSVELPGHGSTPDPTDFDRPTLAPEIATIKDMITGKEELKSGFHLVGHSYGAVVALGAAMTTPFPIKRLTLFESVDVGALGVLKEQKAMEIISGFVSSYKKAYSDAKKHACSRVIDFWGGPGAFAAIPPHIQDMMAAMTKANIRHWDLIKANAKSLEEYRSVDIPVQLIYGGKSNYVAKTLSKAFASIFPNSSLHKIDGASHFMITSHAEECAQIIKLND